MAQRERTLLHAADLPFYLLLPEVEALLHATLDDRHKLFFELLWYTGARVTEALRIRPKDCVLDGEFSSYISLETLKKKPKRANRTIRRMVPLTDPYFINRLQRFFNTHHCRKLEPVIPFSRQAGYNAISKWSKAASLPIDVTPHTLRHSFAVNHLLHGQQLYDIKEWLGHESIRSTEIYLKVLGADKSHLVARTRFRSDLLV